LKRIILAAALAALAFHAAAQQWPSKPIRIVVPYPPGGAVDSYTRIIQQPLAEALGTTVVIENKAGASAMLGSDLVAKSPPDGYTLLAGNITALAINVGVYPKMTYDPAADFAPIVRTVDVDYAFVVHPSVPAKTVAEFVAYARANPGKLSYGSAGAGSLPQLAAELLKNRAGLDILHVPYKGGGPLLTDLLGGQIQVAFGDQANLMPHVATGKLRALAVSSPKRSRNYPDLPALAETLPGFEAVAWQGVVAPSGTPAEVVGRLNQAFNKVLAIPEVRRRLAEGGLEAVGGTPDELGRLIRSEVAKWSKVVRDVGIEPD
jgi:tripartite-type tricarboxylate transporter receptor subunit TctC